MADSNAKFETKYETKTVQVDEHGQPIQQQFAPDHPDVEGQNPDTKAKGASEVNSKPAEAKVSPDGSNKEGEPKEARPASDASEATK